MSADPPRYSMRLRHAALAVLALSASACADLRYYAHVAHGQSQLITQRRDLNVVIGASNTDPAIAARLKVAQDARRFAVQQLALPDNRSYTSYVDLKRAYVVWNVFAAPRYAVEPVTHCFPIAGCVPYRGYFDEALADAAGARLREHGNDVFVGGVAAYSTLGWFADPILSSMLRWDDDELVGTIFHELAHQLLYVRDDTAFNESFASFVQREGVREWRAARGRPAPDEQQLLSDEAFVRLALDLRERLRVVYASGLDDVSMEAAKQREIAAFRERYRLWRDSASGSHRYDTFIAAPINNATLLPFGLYDQWTPAFAELFRRQSAQWPAFFAAVRALAKQPQAQRDNALQALLERTEPVRPP